MRIPESFRFSQSSLQDFVDCPRRFELRYLLQVSWPALESEPVVERENHRRAGELFHQMVHQYFAGIPREQIRIGAEDEKLQGWWERFTNSEVIQSISGQRFPEFVLSALLGSFHLLAKYDLLVVEPGKSLTIFDWKTQAKIPGKNTALQKIQSRLYPCLLAMAGKRLNRNQEVVPELVKMVYWYAEEPQKTLTIHYTANQFEQDCRFLEGLTGQIAGLEPGAFLLTPNERECNYCVYRSLCDRGIKAGNWLEDDDPQDAESPPPLDFDFDQIGEIAY